MCTNKCQQCCDEAAAAVAVGLGSIICTYDCCMVVMTHEAMATQVIIIYIHTDNGS